MFQFSGLATFTYGFSVCQFGNLGINARLSAPPELFADFHALLRLLAPRHPPCALSSLATLIEPSRMRPMRLPPQFAPSLPRETLLPTPLAAIRSSIE